MLILVAMLLMGLLAGVWGFMMCFLPAQWDKLTRAMSFADRWTEPSSKRLHLLVRIGNRFAGFIISSVGCWFAYVAVSKIAALLSGRATSQPLHSIAETLPNTPAPGITALSIIVIVTGILMAALPASAIAIFEWFWPAGRSVSQSSAPKVMLFVRLSGAVFALLAFMSLIR